MAAKNCVVSYVLLICSPANVQEYSGIMQFFSEQKPD